jgi:hypothetical protein
MSTLLGVMTSVYSDPTEATKAPIRGETSTSRIKNKKEFSAWAPFRKLA